ncbi:MAG: hypothetical protein ACI9MB_002949, partial [Verrucomicrobiales bacterium]
GNRSTLKGWQLSANWSSAVLGSALILVADDGLSGIMFPLWV